MHRFQQHPVELLSENVQLLAYSMINKLRPNKSGTAVINPLFGNKDDCTCPYRNLQ